MIIFTYFGYLYLAVRGMYYHCYDFEDRSAGKGAALLHPFCGFFFFFLLLFVNAAGDLVKNAPLFMYHNDR